MKKIVTSVGMIVFVAALVAGGTGAFFSDTETSTGNVFTAGAIDLTIDSVSHYNGMVCTLVDETYRWIPEANVTLDVDNQPVVGADMNEGVEWDAYNALNPLQYPQAGVECTGTWPLEDIGENQANLGTFFDFDDIKPGDEGENTISIHIDSNDAWMCVSLEDAAGSDPADTATEPEEEAGDTTFGDTLADSELDENLHFFAWLDDGDNIFEEGEDELGQTTASELADETWALADSTTGGGPIQGGETQYIGVYWCAGEISVVGNTLSCSGEEMGNEAQTDSWSADLSFYVEQSRNNAEFECDPDTEVPVETASLTVNKIVSFSDDDIEGVDVTDFELHITGPGGDQIVTDEVEVSGLAAGAYTVSEVYSNLPPGVVFDAQFSGACTDNGTTGSVTLDPGDDLTCIITNVVSIEDVD